MMSPWQRHLLAMAGELEKEDAAAAAVLTPETALVVVAALLILVVLVMLCVCGKDGSPKDEVQTNGASKKNSNTTKNFTAVADPAAVSPDPAVEGETNHLSSPGETAPLSNGVVQSGANGSSPFSHSREASSGSGQMRPTSLRELPDLPVTNHKRNPSGAGVVDKPTSSRNSTEDSNDNDAYDHLGAKIATKNVPAQNYDHITLESPRDPSSGTTPASEPDTASEGHYAQVRERTYDVVKDIRARASTKSSGSAAYDPYAMVKDEDDDKDDPYARVKDDPYSRLKDDPYSMVKDNEKEDVEDDYAHLKHDHVIVPTDMAASSAAILMEDDEDPYEKVIGDSSGGMRVVPAPHTLDTDDPYSVVSDQPPVVVVPLNTGGSPIRAAAHSPSAGWGSPPRGGAAASSPGVSPGGGGARANTELLRLQFADEEGDSQDDYATVVKDRNPSTSREEMDARIEEEEAEMIDPYFTTTPPMEPPRMYGANEVGGLLGAVGGVDVDDVPPSRHETKEHKYTKVTARESLASMSARNALNTYEIVPDLPENTYATVEGGSGDGVVRYNAQSSPSLQHSCSQLSETYAEIGASGGYAVPAPEPPSLHSLHSMTKSTSSIDGDHGNGSRPPTSPSSANHPNVIIADDGYAVVSKVTGFSPSETALPQIPDQTMSGSVGSLGSLGEDVLINGVTLHPDYHSVKDCIPDQDNENDPNYESVDEAFSKVPTSSASNPSSSPVRKPAHSNNTAGAGSSCHVTVINHMPPSRGTPHQYEEVSPPASPLASPMSQTSSRASGGVAGTSPSNGSSSNGASSSGLVLKSASSDVEAAEVRDRVLQGHMYEAISEVKTKKKPSSEKPNSNQKRNSDNYNVKL